MSDMESLRAACSAEFQKLEADESWASMIALLGRENAEQLFRYGWLAGSRAGMALAMRQFRETMGGAT